MIAGFVMVAIGLFMLMRAADQFVDAAADLAAGFRISPVLVGALVIGFGTSLPEMLVSAVAAVAGDVDLGVGNVIGSNVANLTLVLGLAALISVIGANAATVRRELPLCVGSVLLFGVLVQNGFTRLEGMILAVLLASVVAWLIVDSQRKGQTEHNGENRAPERREPERREPGDRPLEQRLTADREPDYPPLEQRLTADREPANRAPADREWSLGRTLVRTNLALLGTLLGAWLLVEGALSVAERFSLTGGFVGLTLVAIGTSLPEMMTAIAAARQGETGLIIGNLLGSNIFNSLAVGAVIGLFGPGPLDDENLAGIGTLIMVVVVVVAAAFLVSYGRIVKWQAALLLGAYFAAMPFTASREPECPDSASVPEFDSSSELADCDGVSEGRPASQASR